MPQGGNPFQNNPNCSWRVAFLRNILDSVWRDLTPQGFIELEPDTFFCDLTTGVRDATPNTAEIHLEGNIVTHQLVVLTKVDGSYMILDAMGRTVRTVRLISGRNVLAVDDLKPRAVMCYAPLMSIRGMGAPSHVLDN